LPRPGLPLPVPGMSRTVPPLPQTLVVNPIPVLPPTPPRTVMVETTPQSVVINPTPIRTPSPQVTIPTAQRPVTPVQTVIINRTPTPQTVIVNRTPTPQTMIVNRTPTPPPIIVPVPLTVNRTPTPPQTVIINPTPTILPVPQTMIVNRTPTPPQTVIINRTPTPQTVIINPTPERVPSVIKVETPRVPSPQFLVPVSPTIPVVGPTINIAPSTSAIVLSRDVTDYQSMLKEKSIEMELINLGYTPRDRVIIKDDQGNSEVKYIKAINRLGNILYIELDTKGFVPSQDTDMILRLVDRSDMIPYSVKSNALDCVQHEVSGIVLQCISGICVLKTLTEDLKPKEINYGFFDRSFEGTFDNKPSPYPIVRMSEIRANPQLALQVVANTTNRLRNAAYSNAQIQITELTKGLNGMVESFNRLNEMKERAFLDLQSSMTKIDGLLKAYVDNPSAAVRDAKLVQGLESAQAHRNELTTNLIEICMTLGLKQSFFNKEKVELDMYIEYLQKNYNKLGEISLN